MSTLPFIEEDKSKKWLTTDTVASLTMTTSLPIFLPQALAISTVSSATDGQPLVKKMSVFFSLNPWFQYVKIGYAYLH
jgi:hypothetical protein